MLVENGGYMGNKFWSSVGIIFFVFLPIMTFWTFSLGNDVLSLLAVEHGVCERIDACTTAQKEVLAESIIKNSEYSSLRQVQWCLGTDTFAESKRQFSLWMDVANLFCPDKQFIILQNLN
jgi:hypothetical protein